jgi:hypothetical protein
MRVAITVPQMLVRLIGSIMLVLGALFWTGNALALIPVHMLLGLVLVVSLWLIAGLALRARVPPGWVALGVLWGLLVPVLGVSQDSLLPGGLHWLIQLLHLALGLGAIGLAEMLARRARARVVARSSSD